MIELLGTHEKKPTVLNQLTWLSAWGITQFLGFEHMQRTATYQVLKHELQCPLRSRCTAWLLPANLEPFEKFKLKFERP